MGNGPRRPLDMDELESEPSEFCWGEGLEPPSVRGKPLSAGGMYRGLAPEQPPTVGIRRV